MRTLVELENGDIKCLFEVGNRDKGTFLRSNK